MSEDKKRKRSWREIDRQKDRSYHRREEAKLPFPDQKRSNKAYKAELERFFDSGVASQRIKTLMKETAKTNPIASQESGDRIACVRKVRSAETFDEFISAVDELRDKYGLPSDLEILSRVLEHPDQDTVRDALTILMDLVPRMSLLQLKSIEMRLDALEMSTEDPDTLDLLQDLREKI